MTVKKDLKRIIRARMEESGKTYMSARNQVLRDREEILATGLTASTALLSVPRSSATSKTTEQEGLVDAAILKLNQRSARVRLLRTGEQVTLRSSNIMEHVPGQIVTVDIERRWSHRGHAYANGAVVGARIDIPALQLPPLGLEDHGVMNCCQVYGPERSPGRVGALWRKVTAKPRRYFELEQVLPGVDYESMDFDDPIVEASELNEAGASLEAEEVLMDLLLQDLRCLDAHAHLGNFAFDRYPEHARLHYEVGVRIGEQAFGAGFTGMLPWACIDNRPFLRCLHGYGLSFWRLGQMTDAEHVFERMIWLNPNDNQGARFCWLDVKEGRPWRRDEEGTR
ncbi:hypothetical protein [Polyangium sp. 6x1]|uniref:hypothetical protein n=1 Tax=Polyangium sp. 6x1 TaxID=3042689 RepID=UPI002482C31E|nr:hypothetical protein [Polyangium sp. 6x1]MDI1442430.1 hypothetical protein [Polyangium sp. 6x1]